jgi:hypothetical protein
MARRVDGYIPACSSFCSTHMLALLSAADTSALLVTYGNWSHHADRGPEHPEDLGRTHLGVWKWMACVLDEDC